MSDYDPNYIPQKSFAIVGQKAIILNSKQEFLVLLRSGKVGLSGAWSLPGGALEQGEDPVDSITRETVEETGLLVSRLTPFETHSRTTNENDFVVLIGYFGEASSEEVILNWEHDEYRWVNVDDAMALSLTPDAKLIINQWQKLNISYEEK